MDNRAIKKRFPALLKHPGVIYFDSGSTSQKPDTVIAAVHKYLSHETANAGRGTYAWASAVTRQIEDVRKKVANFINATNPSEVVFTSGATASINTIVYGWALTNLHAGDEILYNPLDHTSNVLPWINLKQILGRSGISIRITPYGITCSGEGDVQDIQRKISSNTRLITLSNVHNVFGTKTTLREIRDKIHPSIAIAMDCSQSIGRAPLDVQKVNLDFASFSCHKVFASTGIGILFINRRRHKELTPFMVGGNSGAILNTENMTLIPGEMPELLEAGTLNIAGIISLGAALDFIEEIGMPTIQKILLDLTQYLLGELRTVPHIEYLPGIVQCGCNVGYGIVSFRVQGISSQDVGFILNAKNIYVRTGNHCISGKNSLDDSIRISLDIYNTKEEIDVFIQALREIVASI